MEKTVLSFCALTSLASTEIEVYYRRLHIFLKTSPLQEKILLLAINNVSVVFFI